jgi:NAD(P)-dependent dehydrogenase (short-subunit alcohol dehydrogenase family)
MSSNNRHWTADDIPNQDGKIALVTGANSGLGFEDARALAGKGATVIMACRCVDKGEAAARQIRGDYPAAAVDVMALDLASLESVRRFAGEFARRHATLQLLINNAGVMALPDRRETADGFEMQFGTNHLGHFALTGLLMPLIACTPGARVVSVSSMAHRLGRINFDDLNATRSYRRWTAYGQSKLANLLFIYELQRRFEAAGVDAAAVAAHPGWSSTHLQQHSGFFSALNPVLAQKPHMGALPTLYAATAAGVSGGEYYGPDGLFGMRGYPVRAGSSRRSYDRTVAARLWSVSEELTGVHYDLKTPGNSRVPSAAN